MYTTFGTAFDATLHGCSKEGTLTPSEGRCRPHAHRVLVHGNPFQLVNVIFDRQYYEINFGRAFEYFCVVMSYKNIK